MNPETERIDKFLWSVRLFKTRSIASEICKKGNVTIAGIPVKSSRNIKQNDVFQIKENGIERTYKIISVTGKRVGAKLVPDFLLEITPEEILEKIEVLKLERKIQRPKGLGRPTKKDRRDIGRFFD